MSGAFGQHIGLRTRSDLVWTHRRDSHGVPTGQTVVKDPLSLRYWLLSEHEWRVLDWLRQPISLADLKTKLESQFFPRRTTQRELQSVVGMLHRRGLVIGEHEGQAEKLLLRKRQAERRKTWQWANVLMLKLPGINLSESLDRITHRTGILLRPTVWLLWMAFATVVTVMVISRWPALVADLPVLDELLTWQTGGMLMVSLAIAKVCHELGHAIACTAMGARCHEIGAALFFFSPCLYCDTSDCWLLPERWKRVTVALAGVATELVLASVVGLIWCLSQPGLFRQQMFYLLVTCTLFSWLINLNPLLRYDGYFVLSDWLDEPNLAQRSREHATGVLTRLWGSESSRPERGVSFARQWLYLLYAVASFGYRCVVIGAALFFVWKLLESNEMVGVGVLLIIAAVGSMAWQPLGRFWKWMRTPTNRRRRGWLVWSFRCALLVGIASFAFIPLPRHVTLDGTLRPTVDYPVFLSVAGRIESDQRLPREGELVEEGAVLARLVNPELDDRQRELQQELKRTQLQLQQLRRRQGSDTDSAARIEATQEQLTQSHEAKRLLDQELAALTLRASTRGHVLLGNLPRSRPSQRGQRGSVTALDLPTWSGVPTAARNQAAWFDSGTLFCRIVDDRRWEIRCEASEPDLASLKRGQVAWAKLQPAGQLGQSSLVSGQVVSISSRPVAESENGNNSSNRYEVRVGLEASGLITLDGVQATVRVRCGSVSLFQRSRRWLSELF